MLGVLSSDQGQRESQLRSDWTNKIFITAMTALWTDFFAGVGTSESDRGNRIKAILDIN